MIRLALALAVLAAPAAGATLELMPGATRAAERLAPLGSYAVPTAPWTEEGLPAVRVEGRILREVWQVPGTAATLEILRSLREQLSAQGYEVLFDCETEGCGGFDFRFETEVLPEPVMHVDLGDFRFLSARRGEGDAAAYVTLMVSRTSSTAYVQIVQAGPAGQEQERATGAPAAPVAATPGPGTGAGDASIGEALETRGRAILPGLSFETGSARLAPGDVPALAELAGYLKAAPSRRVTLVGHTDASGSLQANIALSRARARSVLDRLVSDYGVPAAQLASDGVGYLMPLASNLSEAGRAANRRVEAVLTSTE